MKPNRTPNFIASFYVVLFLSIFGCGEIIPGDNDSPKSDPQYEVATLAGSGQAGNSDGLGSAAKFHNPGAIAIDEDGNLFVADVNNHNIRKITPDGEVTTIAGIGQSGHIDGDATEAAFKYPFGIAIDLFGNVLVTEKSLLRRIKTDGQVETLAGIADSIGYSDGEGDKAVFNDLKGVVVDQYNHAYVSDQNNHVVRKVSIEGIVSTFAGNGSPGNTNGIPQDSKFNHPQGIFISGNGTMYVADESNHLIRKINSGGVVEILAGSIYGYADGFYTEAMFRSPSAVTSDEQGNIYVADSRNFRIRIIRPSGVVETIAGSGVKGYKDAMGEAAYFGVITGIAVDQEGNIYLSDQTNHCIRKLANPDV